MTCPNKFPKVPCETHRLAIVGEAPGKDEMLAGEPFVGASGRFLAALLARPSVDKDPLKTISRDQCFLGNVCQYNPPGNKIESFSWGGYEIQEGLKQLKEDLCRFKPNCVILLGNVPLKAARDPDKAHPLKGNHFKFKNSQWRGSLFTSTPSSPLMELKCLSTYHPAYTLRDYSTAPLLHFDLKKGIFEATRPELVLPKRVLQTNLFLNELLECLTRIRIEKKPTALDIEGGINSMSCISFAPAKDYAFVVPFLKHDGRPYWNREDELILYKAVAGLLEDPGVPKILQNALYDSFVLHFSYGIRIRNVVEDTMLKSWSLFCELEKNLGVQTSIYTNEPYYKQERKSTNEDEFYKYCCKDSAVTIEISDYLDRQVKGTALGQYHFNVNMLLPLRYMEMRGIRYNEVQARSRRDSLRRAMHEEQARLNQKCGFGLKWASLSEINVRRNELFRYKKDKGKVKAGFQEADARLAGLLNTPYPTLATVGEVEDLLDASINVGSNKTLVPFLYETLKLPVQLSDDKENPKPTADYEALLNLSKYCQKSEQPDKLSIIHSIITIRSLATRERMLSIGTDSDGRIRCGYNIVGSDTGRITCYSSPTGSGYNLQTIPNYTDENEAPGNILGDRDLFIADKGYWLFQCDLEGADGWTVAAYCKMLGDPTMFDDYVAGLRPAKILTLMLHGEVVDYKDRNALQEACKKVSKKDWDYFACKRVQHGANYLEGPRTIGRNILTDSEGKLHLDEAQCKRLRDLYFMRYPGITKWHQWVGRQIAQRPVLTAASGQVRQFFGRPDEILTKAVAFEPQANTTYATNKAMWNLWTDPTNRVRVQMPTGNNMLSMQPRGILQVEPLHQVHDALIGQFKKENTAYATQAIRRWFQNTLRIANQDIIIPFEGGYGESWGNLKEGKI